MPSRPGQPTACRSVSPSGAVRKSETCTRSTVERRRSSSGVYALVAMTAALACTRPPCLLVHLHAGRSRGGAEPEHVAPRVEDAATPHEVAARERLGEAAPTH